MAAVISAQVCHDLDKQRVGRGDQVNSWLAEIRANSGPNLNQRSYRVKTARCLFISKISNHRL